MTAGDWMSLLRMIDDCAEIKMNLEVEKNCFWNNIVRMVKVWPSLLVFSVLPLKASKKKELFE